MSNIDRIKEKLAKLLRLGEDQAATDNEVKSAIHLATQLMARHQLTREDIDINDTDPLSKLTYGRHYAFSKGARPTSWEDLLSNFVTDFIGTVKHYCTKNIPITAASIARLASHRGDELRKASAYVFYGPDDDTRCAAEMFEELRDAIATMAIIRWGGWARGDGTAYAFGFAQGLHTARQAASTSLMNQDDATHSLMIRNQSTALAIIDRSQDWLATTHHIKLKKQSSRKVSFKGGNARSAFSQGKEDGSNYDPSRPSSRSLLA